MPRKRTLSEIVEDETIHDDDDDTGDTEPEPDTEPEHVGEILEDGSVTGADTEPEGPSLEASLQAFEAENRRHESALRGIMGDDFQAFELCDGCAGVGYRPETAMQFDPDTYQCPRCKGHGSMLSGSVNEMNVLRACTECAGQGFVVRVDQPAISEPTAPAQPRFDPFTGQPLEPGSQPALNADGTPWAPGYVPPGQPARTAA